MRVSRIREFFHFELLLNTSLDSFIVLSKIEFPNLDKNDIPFNFNDLYDAYKDTRIVLYIIIFCNVSFHSRKFSSFHHQPRINFTWSCYQRTRRNLQDKRFRFPESKEGPKRHWKVLPCILIEETASKTDSLDRISRR